jgi:hypothetical protein
MIASEKRLQFPDEQEIAAFWQTIGSDLTDTLK